MKDNVFEVNFTYYPSTYSSSFSISKILKATIEPQSQDVIFMGPTGDVSPVESARILNINTITKNTKKAIIILRIFL